MKRASPRDGDPTSLHYELTMPLRQEGWHSCCASLDGHRFDCREARPEQRGLGPFGPVARATPRQLVDAIRRPSTPHRTGESC